MTRRRAVLAITAISAILVTALTSFIYSSCLELVVASSNEKSELLQELVKDYRPPSVERRCVHVTINEVASGTAERALAEDWKGMSGPRPQVWSPASKTWLLLLDEDRKLANRPPIVPAVAQSIITSPLVIAMPQPMAEALTQSTDRVGWRDLVTLARDPAGWARFGRPWGAFRFAQTTPFISTSGLHAMISIGNASQVEADPMAFVRDLDSSVLHYADTVRTFLGDLSAADAQGAALSYVSAIAVEEKQVFDYNRGDPNSDVCMTTQCGRIPDIKLVALYPREGTLFADHPFAILDWPDQPGAALYAQAARDLLVFLTDKDRQDAFKSQGFRDDRTQPGPELTKPYFDPSEPTHLYAVPRAAAMQQLRREWKDQTRKPANAVLLLDVSQSTAQAQGGRRRLDVVKDAVVSTVNELAERDSIGLRTFPTSSGASYRELLDIAPLGPLPTRLSTAVKELGPESGRRSLYSAIRAAAEAVQARYTSKGVNAVVLVTDGTDESADRLETLTAFLAQQTDRRVLMFVVALPGAGTKDLRAIVGAAGGYVYEASDTSDIGELVRRALLNL